MPRFLTPSLTGRDQPNLVISVKKHWQGTREANEDGSWEKAGLTALAPETGHPIISGKRIYVKDKYSLTLWTLE